MGELFICWGFSSFSFSPRGRLHEWGGIWGKEGKGRRVHPVNTGLAAGCLLTANIGDASHAVPLEGGAGVATLCL